MRNSFQPGERVSHSVQGYLPFSKTEREPVYAGFPFSQEERGSRKVQGFLSTKEKERKPVNVGFSPSQGEREPISAGFLPAKKREGASECRVSVQPRRGRERRSAGFPLG
jgi:hypothetical protein